MAKQARNIRAKRGLTLRCKGWRQEALLRLLENNLENAERPQDLIIYMSRAKVLRDWDAFDRTCAALREIETAYWVVSLAGHHPDCHYGQR